METRDKLPTLEDVVRALERMNITIPYVTSMDSGKVMQVDSDGKWIAEELQIYEGGVVNG